MCIKHFIHQTAPGAVVGRKQTSELLPKQWVLCGWVCSSNGNPSISGFAWGFDVCQPCKAAPRQPRLSSAFPWSARAAQGWICSGVPALINIYWVVLINIYWVTLISIWLSHAYQRARCVVWGLFQPGCYTQVQPVVTISMSLTEKLPQPALQRGGTAQLECKWLL